MTDEEKAEDYVVCNHCEKYMLGKCHSKKCVKLYLDGLAEGRKEEHDKCCSNPFWVMQLENENAELKEQIEKMKHCWNCENRINGNHRCVDCQSVKEGKIIRKNWGLAK